MPKGALSLLKNARLPTLFGWKQPEATNCFLKDVKEEMSNHKNNTTGNDKLRILE